MASDSSMSSWPELLAQLLATDSGRDGREYHQDIAAQFPDVSLKAVRERLKRLKKQQGKKTTQEQIEQKQARDASSNMQASIGTQIAIGSTFDVGTDGAGNNGLCDETYSPRRDVNYLKLKLKKSFGPNKMAFGADSDDEFEFERKTQDYLKAFSLFQNLDAGKLVRIKGTLRDKGRRFELVHDREGEGGVAKVLYALHDRPNGLCLQRWEVTVWGRAIRLFWEIWPDYDTPLHMVADFLYEEFDQQSLLLFDDESRACFDAIARQERWPNNPHGGLQIAEAMQAVVRRIEGDEGLQARRSRMERRRMEDMYMFASMLGAR